MTEEPVSIHVKWAQNMENMIKMNNELLKYRQEEHQYKLALMECEKIKSDIKNKKITKILVPTIGNNFIQVNAGDEKYGNMLNERIKQFDNSVKGIEGQIKHREDALHEQMLRTYRYLGEYLLKMGLNLPEIINPKVDK